MKAQYLTWENYKKIHREYYSDEHIKNPEGMPTILKIEYEAFKRFIDLVNANGLIDKI